MRWLELSCRVDIEAVEAVSEAFSRVASGGVAVEPDITPDPDDGYVVGSDAVVRGYVPIDPSGRAKVAELDSILGHLSAIRPVGALVVSEIDETDWANAWKSHYSTFRVGRRIVIRPSWIEYRPEGDDIVISLDPGAAFGTGLHPTTRRSLELLEDIIVPGDRVLDVGTGSGILAMASIALGAREVVAIDLDPLAVKVARENAAINMVGDKLLISAGTVDTIDPSARFEVVVANIIARVIVEVTPRLAGHVRTNGHVVVSGIIGDREDEVAIALTVAGLAVVRHADGDWVSFVGTKR